MMAEKKAKGQGGRFIPGAGIARFREWRGVRDTFYDYTQWLRILGVMAKFMTISPVRIVRGLLEYRWFGSYLAAFNMADKCVEGLRGPALRVAREQIYPIMQNATVQLGQMMKGDRRFGENDFAKKIVLLEQTMPPEMLAGFPTSSPCRLRCIRGSSAATWISSSARTISTRWSRSGCRPTHAGFQATPQASPFATTFRR